MNPENQAKEDAPKSAETTTEENQGNAPQESGDTPAEPNTADGENSAESTADETKAA